MMNSIRGIQGTEQKKGSDPILFGLGLAVQESGLDGVEYFSKVSSHRHYREMYSLGWRSINQGCNHRED